MFPLEIRLVTCPGCGIMFEYSDERKKCPSCGYEFEEDPEGDSENGPDWMQEWEPIEGETFYTDQGDGDYE